MNLPPAIRKIFAGLLTAQFRYVLISVIFVVSLIGYLVLIRPQFENVRLVGILAFQAEKDRLADRQAYYSKALKMVEAYRRVRDQQPLRPEDVLPQQPEINDLFLTLKSIAAQSGMTVESIAVSKGASLTAASSATTTTRRPSAEAKTASPSAGTVQILDVTFGVGGSLDYGSFKRVLRTIEQSLRLVDVITISFDPHLSTTKAAPDAKGGGPVLTFEMKTYYLESTSPAT